MTLALQVTPTREERLLREAGEAIGATSAGDLQGWGLRTASILAEVTLRRGKNFGNLVVWIWDVLTKETEGLLTAIRHGGALPHLKGRAEAAHEQAQSVGRDFVSLYDTLSSNLQSKPRETAPKVVAGVLGFLVGSGGVDGDGGIPDLDFLGGVGAHRSIFTHSLVAGVLVETLVLSVLDLSRTVHKNLPDTHDPLWEDLNKASTEVFTALTTGMSLGIAYHLGVDTTIDGGGTYKDLPVSVPDSVHTIIIGTNAVAEGHDAVRQSTENSVVEVESRVFGTFREAADFSKRDRGWVIVRANDQAGFRVFRKGSQEPGAVRSPSPRKRTTRTESQS